MIRKPDPKYKWDVNHHLRQMTPGELARLEAFRQDLLDKLAAGFFSSRENKKPPGTRYSQLDTTGLDMIDAVWYTGKT